MAFDGVFIHYLTTELRNDLIGKRITKSLAINDLEYGFVLTNKSTFIVSANKNFSCFYLVKEPLNFSKTNFGNSLKRYFDGSFIKDVYQIENDRILEMVVEKNDELGYPKTYKLIFEATGKTANIIITDDKDIIIDALHKHFDINSRIIEANAPYKKLESNQINPFTIESDEHEFLTNPYQGVSKLLFQEICYRQSLKNVINSNITPSIYLAKKPVFSCFKLESVKEDSITFDTLNELIIYYINNYTNVSSSKDEELLKAYITRELEKVKNKLIKQERELEIAKDYSLLEKKAAVLANNIYLVKPYQTEIALNDFDGNPILIELNPNIPPRENINYYYNKIKKQKRAIDALLVQIENTKEEILYYTLLLDQVRIASTSSINEIQRELGLKKKELKNQKPAITRYIDEAGNSIYVGKNNTQNDYLTNKMAKPNDYFMHITSYPGCHLIFSGNMDEKALQLCAEICAYHSKMTSTVSIDYTLVKYVKKIKGYKGSFVRYTNQKTIYASGDIDYINKHARLVN